MHETYDAEIKSIKPMALANPRLGIIGGGQLAKMTAMTALQLGCDVVVLERNNYSPAAQLATHSIVGDWENPEALLQLAQQVDVVSIENEFLNVEALTLLEQYGHPLFPGTKTLRLVQDKLIQKQTLAAAGLPVARFSPVQDKAGLLQLAQDFGWPMVLKTRRNGYDGKGNFTLRSEADIDPAWKTLGGDINALYVEAFCPFEKELAIIITRGADGSMVEYPVVETVQRNHVCELVKAPAEIPEPLARRATEIGSWAIKAIAGVGSFGVEMFLTAKGELLINELAPRVHNSGHYTIEACVCSQFENHVRAVLGWPLGSTQMVAPAAVMVNLLGTTKGPGAPRGIPNAMAVPGARVHIYGKAMSGPGRKMGHVTAISSTMSEALATAERAAKEITFGAG